MMVFQRVRAACSAGLIAFGFVGLAAAAVPAQAPVELVPIQGTIDQGTASLVARALAQAQSSGAAAIVLNVDSGSGLSGAANEIRAALRTAGRPVYAYVEHRAYGAAALVALAASHVILAPDASIGAVEPLPGMAQSLTAPLDAGEAIRAHVATGTAATLDAMLANEHLAGAALQTATYSPDEQIARIVTNPIVSGLLLTLGLLGLLVEMQTLHGIAGVIGLAALTLFFGAHIYAGFAGGVVALLAIAGLLGILWELHVVPGHGAPGILGAVALICAVLWAFGLPLLFVGIETISTSIVLTVILFAVVTRAFPENAWMNKLMLRADQGPDYVTSSDFSGLLGASGTADSYLRPSGVANIDGKRVDVLTEGEFIAQGTPIRVTRVNGARIFVEPVHLPSYQ